MDAGADGVVAVLEDNASSIEMLDRDGHNIFGTIDQKVVRYEGP